MTTFANTSTRRGRVNRRSTSSAAAFAGVIGLPDPGSRMDADFRGFCAEFNQRADTWLAGRSAECRSFAATERHTAAIIRR